MAAANIQITNAQLEKLQNNIRKTIMELNKERIQILNEHEKRKMAEIVKKIIEKENIKEMIDTFTLSTSTCMDGNPDAKDGADSMPVNKEFTDNDLEEFQKALNNMLSSYQFKKILDLSLKAGELSDIQAFVASFVMAVTGIFVIAACIAMPGLIFPVAVSILPIIVAVKSFNDKLIEFACKFACNKTNEFFAESLGLQKNGGAAFTSRSRTVFFNSKDNTRDALSEKRNTYDDDSIVFFHTIR